ncbi:hypothetical protein BgAZ_200440 [Babesia gibsoni]|uniref:Uncharacterized protein n=1 Tax=Babesia gibsoni TaxID=33632 RepID=A0AAD8LP98_BABGI|nr:hypothetical protein BgAZ_200440 [Babesia gibsoni]
MADDGCCILYDAGKSDDPYVSAVAAHGDVVVTGTWHGDLYLSIGERREFINSYHSCIVNIELKRCAEKELDGFIYVVCVTGIGYIYVHLVCINNISASRTIYKFRTGQEIVGIALHPQFVLKHPKKEPQTPERFVSSDEDHSATSSPSLEGEQDVHLKLTTTSNKRRKTYDLRKVLSHRQHHRKCATDIEYGCSSFVVALAKGFLYMIHLDKIDDEGPARACSLIHVFKQTNARTPISWSNDMLTVADCEGTQILMLDGFVPVAFMPHEPPISHENRQRDSWKPYTPLAELVDLDEFYNTSDESDVSEDESVYSAEDHVQGHTFDNRKHGTLGISQGNSYQRTRMPPEAQSSDPPDGDTMGSTIHSCMVGDRKLMNNQPKPVWRNKAVDVKMTHDANQRGHKGHISDLGVSLCWLNERQMMVGIKNKVRIIEITQSDAWKRDRLLKTKQQNGELQLLETGMYRNVTSRESSLPFISLKERKIERYLPLRGFVPCSLDLPGSYRIISILKRSGECQFTILAIANGNRGETKALDVKMAENAPLTRTTVVESNETIDGNIYFYGSRNKRDPLVFTMIDPCYDEFPLCDSFVQCIRAGDGKRSLKQLLLINLICSVAEHQIKVKSSHQILLNSFICLSCENMEQPKSASILKNHPKVGGIPESLKLVQRNTESFATESIDDIIHDVVKCFRCQELHEGLYMFIRGIMFSIEEATLQQHIEQLCYHKMHHYALEDVINHHEEASGWPQVEQYVRHIFKDGIHFMLACHSLNVRDVSYLTLMYIKACKEFISNEDIEEYIHEIVTLFAKYRRLNILLGYIAPLHLEGETDYYRFIRGMMKTYIVDELKVDMPFVMLRMAMTSDYSSHTIHHMITLLREYLVSLASLYDTKNYSHEEASVFKENEGSSLTSYNVLVDSKVEYTCPSTILCDKWKLLVRECDELNTDNLDLHMTDTLLVSGLPSDFELLNFYSDSGYDSLEGTRFMRYGPQVRAAILCISVLMARTDNIMRAFKFQVHAETPMAINTAKVLCDIHPEACGEVIDAIFKLYSTDPQKTNDMLADVLCNPIYVNRIFEKLKDEPKFLFIYLDMLHTECSLPKEYRIHYFRLLCSMKPLEVISFLKQACERLDEGSAMYKEFRGVILQSQRDQRSESAAVAYNQLLWIQKELYLAEAFLRWVDGKQWYHVYTTIMMAFRLDMAAQKGRVISHKNYVESMFNRLTAMVYRIFYGYGHDNVLKRIVNEVNLKFSLRGESSGLEVYLRYMQYNADLTMGLYTMNVMSMTRAADRVMDTLKRGIIVSVTDHHVPFTNSRMNDGHYYQTRYPQMIEGESGNVIMETNKGCYRTTGMPDSHMETENVCSLCHCSSVGFPCDSQESLDIIHLIYGRMQHAVKLLPYKLQDYTLYFFCGHVAHEQCQVRLINEAISLRALEQRKSYDAPRDGEVRACSANSININGSAGTKIVDKAMKSCLVCMRRMKELRRLHNRGH